MNSNLIHLRHHHNKMPLRHSILLHLHLRSYLWNSHLHRRRMNLPKNQFHQLTVSLLPHLDIDRETLHHQNHPLKNSVQFLQSDTLHFLQLLDHSHSPHPHLLLQPVVHSMNTNHFGCQCCRLLHHFQRTNHPALLHSIHQFLPNSPLLRH